jgi:hypothetical protein
MITAMMNDPDSANDYMCSPCRDIYDLREKNPEQYNANAREWTAKYAFM